MYNLEFYIEKNINNKLRADILTNINNRRFAFEYQRSYITTKEVLKRTILYRSDDITPIWILGHSNHTPRIKPSYILNYISNIYNSRPSFIQLTQSMLGFKKVFPIVQISQNKIYCEEVFLPFRNYSPKQVLSYNYVNINSFELSKQHIIHKEQWRLTPKNINIRRSKLILNEMYLQRISPLLIPIEVGVPVPFSYFIKECPVEWQLKIYLFVLNQLNFGQSINIREIERIVLRLNLITPNKFPVLENIDYFLPIYFYLSFLCEINVLQKDNNGNFIKVRDFKRPNHIEEALKADNKIIDIFTRLTINKIIGERY
ncbi:MAG: competence protein CoiA endonuclease [Bacillales bacterium]|jgi:competence CoiA-like predicted nuclease|nr:competence protein CoiA endonuclease [Bacillales bacterium]